MEAKDTVISEEEMNALLRQNDFARGTEGYRQVVTVIKEAQAEISFRAGYETCAGELEQYLLKWKRAGIREVVEFINQHWGEKNYGQMSFTTSIGWQAKLKGWEIE